jgi:hypothetical protein
MPEQRRFKQGFGDGRTVFRNEGALLARAVEVNRARHQLFARAALAFDDDRQAGVGHAIEKAKQVEHAGDCPTICR